MRLTALLTAFILTLSFHSVAQQPEPDSLYRLLETAEEDTMKVRLLLEISRNHDLDDEEGFRLAKEAYALAQETNSEPHQARSKAAVGLYMMVFDQPDSGMSLINEAISQYEKLGLINKISDINWNLSLFFQRKNDFDSTVYYLNRSLEFAEESDHKRGVADANFFLGSIHNIRGDNSLALKYSTAAKDGYEKAGMKRELGEAHNQIGIIYDYMGMYSEALENYLIAKEIAVEIGDNQGELLIINNLGVMYDNMNNSELALKYYTEALEKSGIFEYEEDKATLLNNLSYIYLKEGDTTRAKTSLWEALKITQKSNVPCFDIYPLEGMGSLYVAQNQLDSANYYLQSAFEKATDCEDVAILTSVNRGLGMLYAKKGQYRRALSSLEESLDQAKMAGLSRDIKESLLAIANFHKERSNSMEALKYLESYRVISDSLYEAKNSEKAVRFAAEYEFRKQVEALKEEQLEAEIAFNQELRTKKRENQFILLVLVLFFLLAVTLARSYYFIQKQNKKLKWLNEEKNTLMGIVAHDLRNPLNMIKSLMQLITGVKTHSKEENSEQYLHLIRMSTQKMSDMIDKVLDISAVENMKVNLNMTRVNLTESLQQTSQNFQQIAEKKDIIIKTEFDANEGHFSNLDANYFDQVMDNLVSNAIKFSDRGTNIYLGVKQEEGHQIISVKDEGPGLSAEEKEGIFKQFATFTAKPTNSEKSTGLGLSIVKKFVTAMKGDIHCESEPGNGTTFFLTFEAV